MLQEIYFFPQGVIRNLKEYIYIYIGHTQHLIVNLCGSVVKITLNVHHE